MKLIKDLIKDFTRKHISFVASLIYCLILMLMFIFLYIVSGKIIALAFIFLALMQVTYILIKFVINI